MLSEKTVLRRIVSELAENPLWKVIVLRNNWLCPYCGHIGARELAMDEEIEQKIAWHFLHECERWDYFEAQPRTREQLKRRAKLIVFKTRFAKLLSEDPRFRFCDSERSWLCPFCTQITQVPFDPSSLDLGEGGPEEDPFVTRVCRHLLDCPAYTRADQEPRSESELSRRRDQSDRERRTDLVRTRFEQEAAFRFSDVEKRWLCPFCAMATNIRLNPEALSETDRHSPQPQSSDSSAATREMEALPFPPQSDDDLDIASLATSDDGSRAGEQALEAMHRSSSAPASSSMESDPTHEGHLAGTPLPLSPAAEELFLQLAAHLEGCKAFNILDGNTRPSSVLKQKVAALNRGHTLTRVRRKLARHSIWQLRDANQIWYCPYCSRSTGHGWPFRHDDATGTEMPYEGIPLEPGDRRSDHFVVGVLDHLGSCDAYSQRRSKVKSSEYMSQRIGEANRLIEARHTIRHWLLEDPVFGVTDGYGSWVCPHCQKPQKQIHFGLISESAVFDKTVELVLTHLHDACGAYALAVGEPPTITREQLEAAVSSNSRGPSPTNMESPVSPVATDEEWLRLQQEVSDLRVQVEAQREHEQSLEEARSKQLRLLPKIPEVEGYEFGCMFRSCDRVGGDFYDFPQISESEWGIAIGDVSGHGVEAAMLMGLVKKVLQKNAREAGRSSPMKTLLLTNTDLYPDLDAKTFVTAFYGVIDTRERLLRFSRAGHNALILFNIRRDPPLQVLDSRGMALGMDPGPVFLKSLEQCQVSLEKGDLFVQFTDGVQESMNENRDEFGIERLHAIIERYGQHEAEYVLYQIDRAIEEFMGSAPQKDDVTMIAVKVLD